MKKFLLSTIALGAMSCATTTKITTEEPGAKVALIDEKGDKKELGVTPYTHESKMWIWQKETIEVTQGGASKKVELSRSEFDAVPGGVAIGVTVCSAGTLICVGVPVFLAGGMKLPEETKVVFDQKTGSFIRVPLQPESMVAMAGADVEGTRTGAQQY